MKEFGDNMLLRSQEAIKTINITTRDFRDIEDEKFLADRTIGRAFGTMCRLSSSVCRRLWRFVLWQNGAS